MTNKRSSALLFIMLTTLLSSYSANAKNLFIEYEELGKPEEVLQVKEAPVRQLVAGEVRVRVLASPIHPSNLLKISGNYGEKPELPAIPGSEGVGRVVEVSEGVTHLSKGQLVLLLGGEVWRSEIISSAANFIPLTGLDNANDEVIDQLSMSVVNPAAALLMLTSFADLKEGDWIVQSAANSAVGGYLIQLAKARGIKTINVVRRSGLEEDLLAKGGDIVLIDGEDLTQKIRQASDNAPIALAIDAVGGQTFARLAGSLAYQGTLITYGVMSGKAATLNPALSIFNDIRIRGFWLSKWFETATAAEKQSLLGQIIPLIATGALKANIDSRYSLEEIKNAVARAQQGGRSGKVLLKPALD